MALVPTVVRHLSQGNSRAKIVDLKLDNSYPTGGSVLTPASVGLVRIDTVDPTSVGGRGFEWIPATNKLKVYSSGTTEVTNATDLSAVTVRCEVVGV